MPIVTPTAIKPATAPNTLPAARAITVTVTVARNATNAAATRRRGRDRDLE